MGKTYGEKPIVFKFEENGEEYMIGSEVGNYLRLFRGALYKKYPGLMRRTLSNEERKRMIEMGHSQHVTSSTISLLLTKESYSCNIQSRFLCMLRRLLSRRLIECFGSGMFIPDPNFCQIQKIPGSASASNNLKNLSILTQKIGFKLSEI
jgi:hypothetical protein